MTKKRRLQLNLGVMALALGALAVDKLVLHERPGAGPEPVDAAALAEEASGLGTGAQAQGGKVDDRASVSGLDRRLAEFDTVDPQRDPFQMSQAMLARMQAPAAQETEPVNTPPGPDRPSTEEFQSRHRLDAVLVSGGASLAVVNGLTVHLGESVDGFTLLSVEDRSAMFARGTDRVTLTLPLE